MATNPKKPFRLDEHPALKQDFFQVPPQLEDTFPYRMQQRLAQEAKRNTSRSLGWVLSHYMLPAAALLVLVFGIYWQFAPTPTSATPEQQQLAQQGYESLYEEALADPTLTDEIVADLFPEVQVETLKPALTGVSQEVIETYVLENIDDATLLEMLDTSLNP